MKNKIKVDENDFVVEVRLSFALRFRPVPGYKYYPNSAIQGPCELGSAMQIGLNGDEPVFARHGIGSTLISGPDLEMIVLSSICRSWVDIVRVYDSTKRGK